MWLGTCSLGLRMLGSNSESTLLLLAKEVRCYVPEGIAKREQLLNPAS